MIAEVEPTPRHLVCLNEITRLFLHSQETAKNLAEVFAAVVTAVPVRSAVLIEERQGKPRIYLWNAPSATSDGSRLATDHANTTYAYLADYDGERLRTLKQTAPSVLSSSALVPERDGDDAGFIVLPLVVGPKGIFGVLQLQCATGLDELDLAFVAAVTSELALALDRQYAWELHSALLATAEAAVRSRDETLAVVAHDLGTLLSGILLLSSIGLRSEPTRERRRSLFESIEGTARRMSRLIDDLVDAAVIDSGQFSVDVESRTAERLVMDALVMMRPLAAVDSLILEAELLTPLAPVLADRERVQQIFANLLSNAIKHTPAGGVIRVGAEPARGAVLFSVTNPGKRIDPADLPHVFDRYWRARTSPGAGLGLFIARGIVEAHGGRIWVETQFDSGTRFCFTLPAFH